ncbi:hypothetical protein KBA27_02600 [bacterium]|nr:hypothetical protein [bacterium]
MIDIKTKYAFEKKYPIDYHQTDLKNVLKPSALLNILQDIATINAEMLGFGYSFTYPKNYGWFLIKYRMEFENYPQNLTECIVRTEARGLSKLMASRDFELSSTDGKKLGRISSQWLLIDLESKRILPIKKVLDFVDDFQKREDDLQFPKLKPIEKVDFEKTFEIRYDDIDINQHVNNANYVIWATEPLPFEFLTNNKIKTLDIIYKKEIAYGNNVISSVEFDENNKISHHVLKNATNNDELCFLSIEWE